MRMFRRLTGWALMGAVAMASTGCIIVKVEGGGETVRHSRSALGDVEWEFVMLDSHAYDDGNGRVFKFLNITPVKVVDVDHHSDSLSVKILDIPCHVTTSSPIRTSETLHPRRH